MPSRHRTRPHWHLPSSRAPPLSGGLYVDCSLWCGCPQGSHWAQSSPPSWGKEVRAVGPLWAREGTLGRSHLSSFHLSVWV